MRGLRPRCRYRRLKITAVLLITAVTMPAAGQPLDRTAPAAAGDTAQEGRVAMHLYFADRNAAALRSEVRAVEVTGGRTAALKRVIAALIAGPKSELMRTLPEETELRAAYWSEDGTATVDFTETLAAAHPGGCATELLTVFSIVNTLVLNLDGVRQVKILVGGRETATLAGHVDIRYPLQAEMLMVQ